MESPQVVIFDLFETLVTEVRPGCLAEATPADRLGIDVQTYRRVRRSCHHKGMTREVDYRDILARACRAAGIELTKPTRALIEDIYRQRVHGKAAQFGRIETAVLDMLRQLRARDFRLGLISNCSVEEVTAWESSALAPMFDEVVFSYQVGHIKPEPEIYLHACRRLGASPARAVFVGDGGSDELRGAADVGMRAYAAGWFVEKWGKSGRDQIHSATAGFARLDNPAALLSVLGLQ